MSLNLKEELKKAVIPLEDVLEHQKDWHPGSDGTVLDLVHPSLFPLIYERSRILPDSTIDLDNCLEHIGKGVVVPSPMTEDERKNRGSSKLWSDRFQWLPCNVSFPDGESARIDSYINNLHPKDHAKLYQVIEKIITKAVAFWNVVYQSTGRGMLETSLRINCDRVSYTIPDGVDEYPPDDFDGDEDAFYENVQKQKIYDLPEPEDFEAIDIAVDDVEKKFTFLDLDNEKDVKKLQVIVKLANIHLTPEKPEYKGGAWHIEGQYRKELSR